MSIRDWSLAGDAFASRSSAITLISAPVRYARAHSSLLGLNAAAATALAFRSGCRAAHSRTKSTSA